MRRCHVFVGATRRRLWVAAAVVAGLSAAAAPGAAQEDPGLDGAQEQVRRQQRAVAEDLDILRAQDAEVEEALAATATALAEQEAAVVAAAAELAAAEQRVAEARAAVAALGREIRDLERQLQELAIDAYIGSGRANPLGVVLAAEDVNEAAERLTVVDVVAVDTATVVDRLEAARSRQEATRRAAEQAADDAAAQRQAAEDERWRLAEMRSQQEALAVEVETRIESRLSEAAALADFDAELAAAIAARQAQLAAQARPEPAPGVAPPAPEVPEPTPSLALPPSVFDAPVVPLATVRGIRIHTDIADELEALLAAAEADGVVLGGGGYRDPLAQWRLRVQNCPDPTSSPASACAPPTARPGQSNHERGLAVDFTVADVIITSQLDPAFVWLAARAAEFGFYNLPSEPWHWSIDGS